jgi:tetratricopeptide (TPR) repeat protein
MRESFWSLAALATLVPAGTAQFPDMHRLREAAQLPVLSSIAAISYLDGFVCIDEEIVDPHERIAAFRRDLAGKESDPERYSQLALLYEHVQDENHAKQARERAAILLRQQLEARPNNALAANHLGLALIDLGHKAEGGVLLRRAVQIRPGEWRFWMDLVLYLKDSAMDELFGQDKRPEALLREMQFAQISHLLSDRRTPRQRLARALAHLDEARACLDRAVAAAPDHGEPCRHRAAYGLIIAHLRAAVLQAQGKPADLASEHLHSAALADFRRAAQLSPTDCHTQSAAAWFSVVSCKLEASSAGGTRWQDNSAARQLVGEAVGRLEALARSKDAAVAADSAFALGVLYPRALEDPARGEAHLRQAIRLNPSHEMAGTILSRMLIDAGRKDDLVSLCRERVRAADSARNRFQLAAAYDMVKQPGKTEEQLRAAVKLDPKYIPATLGLAALLLRSGNAAALVEAKDLLDRTGEFLVKRANRNQQLDYQATLGIYKGLKGDQTEASCLLRHVLEQDKDHEIASEAIRALGQYPD